MIRAVIIDSREPPDLQGLRFGVAPTTVQALPCGDAMIAAEDAMLLIERKTLSDLLASIADGRLLAQCAEMVKVSEWSYIVIVGIPQVSGGKVIIDGRATEWQWQSVQGALLTAQELGVATVWTQDYHDCLEWLASRNRGTVRIERKRAALLQSPAEVILMALPGISDIRATALLKHCGTAAWALNYLTRDGGGDVPGIGPATKQAARAALGLCDEHELRVLTKGEQ